MAKHYHFSGFLYHFESQQVLLQSPNPADEKPTWNLIGGDGRGGKTAEEDFLQLVGKLLKLKLRKDAVHPIYDYAKTGKKHYVSYAEVDKKEEILPPKTSAFTWFSLKEISKLNLSPQTKQDIIVGQRVIASSVRRDAGELTIG